MMARSTENVETRVCAIHGAAFTYGCPGCEEADDAALAATVCSRLRWWRRTSLCRRFGGCYWRELETGVSRCRVCGSLLFSSEAADDAIERWLLGSGASR